MESEMPEKQGIVVGLQLLPGVILVFAQRREQFSDFVGNAAYHFQAFFVMPFFRRWYLG